MKNQFTLDQKQTTTLRAIFFVLLVLVFVAGYLCGTLIGLPQSRDRGTAVTPSKIVVRKIAPPAVEEPDEEPDEDEADKTDTEPDEEAPDDVETEGDTDSDTEPSATEDEPEKMPTAEELLKEPPQEEADTAVQKRYAVQVGAFSRAANAAKLMEKLEAMDYAPYIYEAVDGFGKQWHTVRIADFADLQAAKAAVAAFRQKEQQPAIVTHINSLSPAQYALPRVSPAAGDANAVPTGGQAIYTVSAEETSRHPHLLQLASFRTIDGAARAVSTYGRRGLQAFFITVGSGHRNAFRIVFTGAFGSYDEAWTAKRKYGLEDAIIKKLPWANLIGTFDDKTELKEKIAQLENEHYSPYVIQQADGALRLLVGASRTRTEAETTQQALAQDGFENEVIER